MQHTIALAPIRVATPEPIRRRGYIQVTAASWVFSHQRTLATAVIVVLILAAIAVAALSLLVQPPAPLPADWMQVTVEPNASLWTLASAHPVTGLSTGETAALIAEHNGLESGVIHPGQTVRVPSEGPADTAVALR